MKTNNFSLKEMLLNLPAEILELIFLNLDSKSCLSLLQTCRFVHGKLSDNAKFYRHVCLGLGLGTTEWRQEKFVKCEDPVNIWKLIFSKWTKAERVISNQKVFAADRFFVDIESCRCSESSDFFQIIGF